MDQYLSARKQMVMNQIIPNALIPATVQQAFLSVPRHEFVLPKFRDAAYADTCMPYAPGKTLLTPLVLARLISALDISGVDNILDLGCGNGYSSALLARLGKYVTATDPDAQSLASAKQHCTTLKIANVTFHHYQVAEGYEANQPYHAVFIGRLVKTLPESLFRQLAVDGRLIAILDRGSLLATATLFERKGEHVVSKPLFEVPSALTVPLL